MKNRTSSFRLGLINSSRSGLRVLSAVCFLAAACGASAQVVLYPANNGFESPDLGSGTNAYGIVGSSGHPLPSQVGWIFTTGTGIAANGSAYNVTGATNGNSTGVTSTSGQAAVISQGNGNVSGAGATSISQSIAGFLDGFVTISFSLEGRNGTQNGNQLGPNPITVWLDNISLGVFTPTSKTSFQLFSTTPIAVSAGTHVLAFAGTTTTVDSVTTYLDNVSISISPVPEPATLGLAGLGLGAALFYRRKSRRA